MGLLRAAYFTALFGASWKIIHGPMVLKSQAYKAHGPVLQSAACFAKPGFEHYPWLGPKLDQINCVLNSIFISSNESPAAVLFMKTFGAVFFCTVLMSTYEGFRPQYRRANVVTGTLARASSFFLLLGQLIAAGCSTPLQMIFSALSSGDGPVAPPAAEYIWTALVATLVTFNGTFAHVVSTNWSYRALSIWQPFPVYTCALALVLPPILRAVGLGHKHTRIPAIVIIAALGTAASVQGHVALVKGTVLDPNGLDIKDVFLVNPAPLLAPLSYGAHLLFVWDFVFVTATVASLVVFTSGSLVALVPIVGISALAGPGAGLIIPWAVREINASHAAANKKA
ncbi:uncharacterized protein EHS24_001250 [Apiotrichum porosum]|uniref:Uncharacterized protein n=1 Tax=Apiotrichum porosum TaxID=105984 RepID=A0A427XJZ0_9TREE|nr:uncharacterized protein EHS24_001250 [Apiotrichum porosum]RSH79211.1 hypothetical protein EHS24_001250 [Apiotrichum porosum]